METRPTATGGGGATTQPGFLSSLFPRFDAAVSPEFYRLTGRLRAFTNLLFLLANFVIAPQVKSLGFDPAVHWKVVIAFTCIHSLDIALSTWVWRGRLTTRQMRTLTFAGVVVETCAVVTASWVYGSVNSPFIGIELVFMLVYRIIFDFRIGFLAFAMILVGQWVVVTLEIAGVLPHQPMSIGAVDAVYGTAAREIGSMVYLSVSIVLTFAVVNWSVGRLRHKELANKLLREQLYNIDKAKIGRHTGRTLGDTYALGALIGVGGMGEVYVATHLRTQRKVAVKMLHGHLIEDRMVLSRFRREATITGQLGSEHIVGVIDVDEDSGDPYIVLELVEGQSLEAKIAATGALPVDVIGDIVEQLARGLDVAHKAGVIHRDLKPENVFLCPRREGGVTVKILDFGVSKIRGNATAITNDIAILGTPDFMSPEQAMGQAESVDATSDVFALGGVAYKCLTGHRPFVAESVPALLRKICDEEPPSIGSQRSDLPPAVSDVIAIALAKQPGDRYASASEFARDLRAALAGTVDPVIASRAHALGRVVVGQRRRRPSTIDATGETHRG